MAATTFESADDLKAAVGTTLGPTEWVEIDQERINTFAEATGDHQWIHVDVERAKQGPFGGPIAHGYLTLSMTAFFLGEMMTVTGASAGVNYGANKVRFPAPVPVGSRVRGVAELTEVTDVPGGVQMVTRVAVEIDGSDKPACVVDMVSRWLF